MPEKNCQVESLCFGGKHIFPGTLAIIVLLQGMMLTVAIFEQSTVSDEYGHFYAGLAYWQDGDVRLFNVNPPLVRAMGTFIASADPWPKAVSDWKVPLRPEFVEGRRLTESHPKQLIQGLRAGRLVVANFAVLGTILCGIWGRQLAGDLAGIVAAGLWAFQPQVIAHGSLITNDVPVAVSMLLAAWCFDRWLQLPSEGRALVVGGSLGLAVSCKFTALILLPIFLGFTLFHIYRSSTARLRIVAHAVLAIIVMLLFIAIIYRFEGLGKPLGELQFISQSLTGSEKLEQGNLFQDRLLGRIPIPLPEQFLLGLDRQQLDFEIGLVSFARGQRDHRGWWWFYLYSMLVKLPTGTWLAIMAALIGWVRQSTMNIKHLVLPALVALAIVEVTAFKSGFAQQHRYIFPLYPFMFLLIAATLGDHGYRRFEGRMVLGGLALTIVACIGVAPHWLGAFNLLSGGVASSHYHLFNDATDWGQDTQRVIDWLNEHPQCRPFVIHSGNSFHGTDFYSHILPHESTADSSGQTWYIISKTDLSINPEFEQKFLNQTPAYRIGATHHVYREN